MTSFFAGLDVSTQSCKLVVIDEAVQDVAHVDLVEYDKDLPQFETEGGVVRGAAAGVSESDPTMWIAAVNMVLERLAATDLPIGQIKGVSVSGQQHGLVALDAQGRLARPLSKLWNDYSTAPECAWLTDDVGGPAAMIEAVGNAQRPGYTASKILHMVRHEPESFAKAATLFLPHNYVNYYLTGGLAVTEPGDVSGTGLWNPVTRQWSSAVLDAIHPTLRDKLPPVAPSDRSIGRVGEHLVRRFGFAPQCLVDAGSGDNMYAAVGTGNVAPGVVTVSLGTSGTVYSFMTEAFVDPEGEIANFCDSTGHYLPLACVSNLANGYRDLLIQHGLTHGQFVEVLERTPPGNRGKVLIPWYAGERTPDLPYATPVYFGFGLESLERDALCRAVLEGHVLNLFAAFRRMPVTPHELRLTGGISQSPAWRQTIADVFEVDAVPVTGEGAALGAALHVAWVWRRANGEDVAIADVVAPFVMLDHVNRARPIPENAQVYRGQKRVFDALSRRLRGLPAEDPFEVRARMVNGTAIVRP